MPKSNKKNQVVESTEVTVVETPKYDMSALVEQFGGVKSKVIRFLASQGEPTKNITKLMQSVYPGFIYQHARNVLNTKVKGS